MKESFNIEIQNNPNDIRIHSTRCFICGVVFDEINKESRHHAIPTRMKPVANVIVPICVSCHNKENEEDKIYKRYYHTINSVFLGMNHRLIKLLNKKKMDSKGLTDEKK